MKSHNYAGHVGLLRLDPSLVAIPFATRELAYKATTDNIDMAAAQALMVTALGAKTLRTIQLRSIIAWLALQNVTASQKGQCTSYRNAFVGHKGLRRLDPALEFLTDAQIEAAAEQAVVANDTVFNAITTATSPYVLSKGQKRAVIAWWVLHNLNG